MQVYLSGLKMADFDDKSLLLLAGLDNSCNVEVAVKKELKSIKKEEPPSHEYPGKNREASNVDKECRILLQRSSDAEAALEQDLRERVPLLEISYKRKWVTFELNPAYVADVFTTRAVADLSTFRCFICREKVVFRRGSGCYQHMKKSHRVYKIKPRNILEIRWHACKLCQLRIVCDKRFIGRHVIKEHGLSLEEYVRLKLVPQIGDLDNQELRRLVKATGVKPNGKCSLSQADKVRVPPESVCHKIENLCSYRCSSCQQQFHMDWGYFRRHLYFCLRRDKINHTNAVQHEYLCEVRYYECFSCGQFMFCDTYVIRKHAKHGCWKKKGTWDKYQIENGKYLQETLSRENKDKGKKSSILERRVNPGSFESKVCLTKDIGDNCFFGCDKCPFKTDSWTMMMNHNRKSDHGTGNNAFHRKFVLEAVYHRCKVCHKIILCDSGVLSHHIKHFHQVMIEEYHSMGRSYNHERLQSDDWNRFSAEKTLKLAKQVAPVSYRIIDKTTLPKSKKVSDHNMTNLVANLCKFTCLKCNFRTDSWSVLTDHKIQTHLRGGYTTKERDLLTRFERTQLVEARFHKCRVCGIGVVCDTSFIKRHVGRLHKLNTLERYNELPTKISLDTVPTDENNGIKLRRSEQLGNFSCLTCEFKSHVYIEMRSHVISSGHGLRQHSTSAMSILNAMNHECQLCFETISCGRSKFLRHLINRHKTNLARYCEKYAPS